MSALSDTHASPPDDDGSEAALIEATAIRLFTRYGAADARKVRQPAQTRFDTEGWAALQAAGLPLAMLPEHQGGVGMQNAFGIVRLAGAYALPLPLCESMAANWLLNAVGFEPSDAPVTLTGDLLELREESGAWRVMGELRAVPWGRCSDLVATALHAGEPYLVHLGRGLFPVTPDCNLAGEPRDHCSFDRIVDSKRVALMPQCYGAQSERLLGAALRATQIAGAARSVLDLSVGYAQERRQFGRPIGSFQAVQQMLATMATHTAAASVASNVAFEGVADDLRSTPIAAAKVRAGEAAGVIASIAHQVHGAIGFTREHSLHTLTHRLWSWRDEFGTESEWAIVLGRELAAAGGGALWQQLTDI
jgi:acyl-CoA dehydrogenase